MNYRRVLRTLGLLLLVLAAAQLLPLLGAAFGSADFRGFIAGSLVTAFFGFLFVGFGDRGGEFYRPDGVLVVVGAWVLAILSGAIPYVVSGTIPSVIDALFESASGFTTTGATVLVDIEATGGAMLFWRSLTQWLGGIGIVVLFVALLSELGSGARFLFKLEVPGPKADLLTTRVRDTALALFTVYLALTAAQFLLMVAFGASAYDALTHSLSTVSTGGFSPYSDSVAHFSPALQSVILVFMMAAGVNFSLYFALFRRRDREVHRNLEFRSYFAIMIFMTFGVALDLHLHGVGLSGQTLLDAAFQVVAIITTTGFATTDFDLWPSVSRTALVGLMVIGGCAGSTAGGAKLVRVIVAWKAAMREVRLTFSPNSVIAIALGKERVPESSVHSVVGLLFLWGLAWGVGAILLSVGNVDIVTASTAAITTLSNVGPGLAGAGPTQNFAFFAPWQKLLMIGLMLLGRLEFYALLALAQKSFWRRR